MTHSMVELRKERNITQEELASEIGMLYCRKSVVYQY